MTVNEAKAEKLAENVWLKLLGRVLMVTVGAIMLPATIGMWNWAIAMNVSVSELQTRVVILENNTARGREDRVQFQDETAQQLREIMELIGDQNTAIATLTATIAGQQKQIDRGRQ